MAELYGTLSGNIVVFLKDEEGYVLVYVISLCQAGSQLSLCVKACPRFIT